MRYLLILFFSIMFNTARAQDYHYDTMAGIVEYYIITQDLRYQLNYEKGILIDSVWKVKRSVRCPDGKIGCLLSHIGTVEERKEIAIFNDRGEAINLRKYYIFIPKDKLP